MQLTTLLPLLALLAGPLTDAREHGSANRRNVARHAQHVRAADAIAQNQARHEQLAAENPKAMRKVKRGANGCRVRGSPFTPSTNNSTSPVVSAGVSAASSAAASAVAAASSVVVAVPSVVASAAPSPADGGQNWVAPSAAGEAPSSAAAAPPAESSAAPQTGGNNGHSGGNHGGNSGGSAGGLTPRGIKAGASGVETLDAFKPHISWFWNYGSTRDTSESSLIFVPTVWGNGGQGEQDSSRLWNFNNMNWNPEYVQGFYEPDCSPPMSSAIDPYTAAPQWNSWVVPWRQKGALLISPGLCKQADEDWLTPFKNQIGDANMWDITSIHINKVDMAGAKRDIEHYWNTYGKPMWVTEFACVDDSNGFTPCTDQGQINAYINDIVDLMENDSRIYAYSMSEGMGLGDVWPPWKNGQLSESGQTYLNAISKYS